LFTPTTSPRASTSGPPEFPGFSDADDRLRFHPTRRLTRDDVEDVVAVVARRIAGLLRRRGLAAPAEEGDPADTWADVAPVLAGLAAASVRGRLALGPRAGARVGRYGRPPEEAPPATLGPGHATVGGFDLHAGIVVRPGDRERLERLCRYTLRPSWRRRGCASTRTGRSG
jgi:hypothetical protein